MVKKYLDYCSLVPDPWAFSTLVKKNLDYCSLVPDPLASPTMVKKYMYLDYCSLVPDPFAFFLRSIRITLIIAFEDSL